MTLIRTTPGNAFVYHTKFALTGPPDVISKIMESNMSSHVKRKTRKTIYKTGSQAAFLSAALLVVSPTVLAEQGSIGVYGRAHVSADILSDGDDTGTNLSSNSSRIGVRGSLPLTEGLTGILQIEQQINYDVGGNSSRDTFVGLQGDFGRVRLGLIDSPLKSIRSTVDFFGDQIGDARNLTRLHTSSGSDLEQDVDSRLQNSIYYNTPTFGNGFVFNLHYSSNTTGGTNPPDDDASAISTSITYNNSNLYAAAAYEQWEGRNDSSAIRLGVRYRIADWALAGLYQQVTVETLEPVADVQTIGAGASYQLTPKVILKSQLYSLSNDRSDHDATLIAIGADYVFNSQFRLLFAYAATDNDELATYRASGGGGHGAAVDTQPGETATGFSVGVLYDF